MQQFRNLLKGWLGKFLLTIFILPFAFFGIEGIFNSGGNKDIAFTVNGAEVSKYEVTRAIENQRQTLKQQMGGNIDDSFFTDELLRPRVVEGLIQRELIKQAIDKQGLTAATDAVKSYVRSMPQFQDESGAFSNDRLETILIQANYTKDKLFQVVLESMVIEQLQSGVGGSAFVTDAELEYLTKLNGQKRDFSHAKLLVEPFKVGLEISDAEMEEFYQKNQQQYRTQEQVDLEYVSITQDDFVSDSDISEDELLSAYDEYVRAQEALERRRASHVLVETSDDRSDEDALARINEAQEQLAKGISFADVAKEYSDDIASANQGGDLDFAGRGMYDAAFEEALFSLKENNQISGVVKTEFGYHLIQLTDVERQGITSFQDMKATLEQKLAKQYARDKLDVAIDEINLLAFESGDLQVISEKFSKPIEKTGLFTQAGGKGISADKKIVDAAFSDNVLIERHNSDAIELSDGQIVVIRLAAHEESRDLQLSEVEDQVKSALTLQKARSMAKDTANEIVDKLSSGEDMKAVAESYSLSWANVSDVTRQSSDASRTALSAAFELPKPTDTSRSVKKVSLPNGDQEIVLLSAVKDGDTALDAETRKRAKLSSANEYGRIEFEKYVATLKDNAEINIF